MKYVVEIQGPSGDKARKEFDAPNMRAAMRAVEIELKEYPKCRITDIWAQGERETYMYGDLG
jgi:hypothetical protein